MKPEEHEGDLAELIRFSEPTDRCLTVGQLREFGLSKRRIETLVGRGLLKRVFRGVYAVATTALTWHQAARCALLAGGPHAFLSERTALEARGAATAHRDGQMWVGVAKGQRRTRRRSKVVLAATGRPFTVHYGRPRRPPTLELVDGLPTADGVRSLVDASVRAPKGLARRWIRQAEFDGWLDEDALADELELGRNGTLATRQALPPGPLRAALTGATESKAELRLLRALLDAGVAEPAVNRTLRVDGFDARLDLWWQREMLAVEVDGPHHEKPQRRHEDRQRDERLAAVGIETRRFSTRRVRRELAACVAEIAARLNELRRERAEAPET
ncbi:MAG: DUF559 domain-containing protein [Patulibacter minatonensis]